jgi:hypothetical protein
VAFAQKAQQILIYFSVFKKVDNFCVLCPLFACFFIEIHLP